MIPPKKPRAARAAPAPAPAPAAELTAEQLRAAQLLALMSDETQEAMLNMMAEMAISCPRHKRPALRLVGGGAK